MTFEQAIIKFYDESPLYSLGQLYRVGDRKVRYYHGLICQIGYDRVEYSFGKLYKIGGYKVVYEEGLIIKIGKKKII